MRNQHHGQTVFALLGKQQIGNLATCGCIEISCRLIRNQDFRAWRKRAGNCHALLLTT